MPTKKPKQGKLQLWTHFESEFRRGLPHVMAWVDDAAGFSELRIKSRDDGTYLAIAKGYGSDGGPVVAFGVGYDVVLCLMALDATIQGGHWRVDKPWEKRES